MNKLLLATAATAALALPALAQEQTNPPQPAPMPPAQMQPAPPTQMQPQAGTNMQMMKPNLTRGQIRQVQAALDKNGFKAGRPDGVWGMNTQIALQNFQTSKGMAPSGQIDPPTLTALQLNPSRFAPRTRAPASNQTP